MFGTWRKTGEVPAKRAAFGKKAVFTSLTDVKRAHWSP
jgi:hypothetical protein